MGTRCREDLHTSIGGPAEDIFTGRGPLEHLVSLTDRFLDSIFLVEVVSARALRESGSRVTSWETVVVPYLRIQAL